MSPTPREGIAQSLAETFIKDARVHGDLPPRRWKDLEPHAREIWYATAHAPVIDALLAVAKAASTTFGLDRDYALRDAVYALDDSHPGWREWKL